MTTSHVLWLGLFLAVTSGLLLAPLYPTWKEWRHPQDMTALAFPLLPAARGPAPVERVWLTADTPLHQEVEAAHSMVVMPGSHFKKLMAPSILFGIDRPIQNRDSDAMARPSPIEALPQAIHWGANGWRIAGDCRIPAAHQLAGSLVITGHLWIGSDCMIQGDIKVHGDVSVGARTVVSGALISDACIDLQEASAVHGPLLCAGNLTLGDMVVLGQVGKPTSVCADNIFVLGTAMAHGTVHARRTGQLA